LAAAEATQTSLPRPSAASASRRRCVALRYQHACSSELTFPQAALPVATVTRIGHRINGGHVCAYLVAPGNTECG
jgi:hypothetical protein